MAHVDRSADQPELPPVYAGPTPADPFGGGPFDIFDMLDDDEEQPARMPAMPPQTEAARAPEPPIAESIVVETVAAEPGPVAPVAEEPPLPVVEPVADAPEAVAGPAVQPIVIGQDDVPQAEPKRGWWKR